MEVACDLEVDVNGEEVFFVNKKIISTFSGRLYKLFNTSSVKSGETTLKVIFHDLPGGAEAFELMTRFCYNNGRLRITSSNTCILYFLAQFMEMTEDVSSSPNLLEESEKSLREIVFWTWQEVITALKQCQDYAALASSTGIFYKIIDSIVCRITTASDTSTFSSSPESSAIRFSCDTKSTMSAKNGYHRAWWFEDLLGLNIYTVEKLVKSLISKKFEHVSISKFLFYYLKQKILNPGVDEKSGAAEVVIDLLYSLDRNLISFKSLFGVLQISSPINLSKCCKSKLESMIGSLIDQATLDNLLIPSTSKIGSLYDVSVVLRFMKSFLNSGGRASVPRLKKVGSLMDLYMAEVGADPSLKPSKFIGISTALPDEARDSHDPVYRAIDLYFEAHGRLSEEEKMKICSAINYEKLSFETSKHLAQNPKFPSRTAIQALLSQQSKLKHLIQDTDNYPKPISTYSKKVNKIEEDDAIILYAKKLDPSSENEKLKAHIQGMQWRVMELEKICKKMQSQMSKIMKTRTPNYHYGSSRSLPRMCS